MRQIKFWSFFSEYIYVLLSKSKLISLFLVHPSKASSNTIQCAQIIKIKISFSSLLESHQTLQINGLTSIALETSRVMHYISKALEPLWCTPENRFLECTDQISRVALERKILISIKKRESEQQEMTQWMQNFATLFFAKDQQCNATAVMCIINS